MVGFSSAASRRWLCVAAVATAAFMLVAGVVWYASGPTRLDVAVATGVLTARTAVLVNLAAVVTILGAVPVVVGVTIISSAALWLRSGQLLLPLTMLITVGETAATVYLLKQVVARERPPVAWLIGSPSTDPSFPSGHTTDGGVVYLLAGLLLASTVARAWARRLLVVAAAGVPITIGLTRVYLGYHWASDVLGGWLLTVAICAAAAFAVCRLVPHPIEPERTALPGDEGEPAKVVKGDEGGQDGQGVSGRVTGLRGEIVIP